MPPLIRPARPEDVAAINRIYGHYVEGDTCTWEERERELISSQGLARRGREHPIHVAELEGKVVAWGALSPYSIRSGWRHTVEDSVFVSHLHQRRGLGRAMLESLIEHARGHGHRQILARVSADQPASLALHVKLGFVETGRLRSVGRKFDRWLDCVYLQLDLSKPQP